MRFVREERKRPQTRGTKREKRRKKCRKNRGNLENEPTQEVLLFAFFSSSFLLNLSSPSEVLLFLFEGTSFFVVVLCITLLRDIKNTPTLCCSTIIMGVLRVKGKDLIAFRC